ncbi:MAG: hypothetical protein Q8S10_10970 [Thiobacillus sp.]|nr:hypothetical protein [Thiobacillus sp.]
MPKFARILAAVCAFFGVWLGVFFAGLILGLPAAVEWLLGPVALVLAAWTARRVWLRLGAAPPTGVLASMALGAAILGGAGFAIGFFGPLIWAPEANQGPLLGIFITGPAGFVLGALAGLAVALRRRN